MKLHRLLPLVLACTLGACPGGHASGTAVVTTGPGPDHHMPPPARPVFDATGWTLLGSQPVNGRVDRDVFKVGKRARYDRLTMVVYDSDLELLDFVVHFANGDKWAPGLKHVFREGQRSRQLDLPGDDRHITEIDLVYKNLPGGGAARVEIYGKDIKNVATTPPPPPHHDMPPPPPPEPAWDSSGWTLLGSQNVDGKRPDVDVFKVDSKPVYDRITILVKDSDVEMYDLVFTFGNKDKYEPKLAHYFKEGQRSRVIDLPGNNRHITEIRAKYRNLPGGGRAKIEIWARDTKGMGAAKKEEKKLEKMEKKEEKKEEKMEKKEEKKMEKMDKKDEAKDPKDPKYKPKK